MKRQERPDTHSDVRRFLESLWQNGDVRELRIPRWNAYGQTASGYFDSPDKLGDAVTAWDGKANLYVTLNPVNPDLLFRANNRVNERAENTTADVDIVHRRWFYLDIDPVRPAGISSTEEEREAALATLTSLNAFLSSTGWPEPLTAMSGNGYYALYRIDLPNTREAGALVKTVLESLAARFDTAAAHIDTSVHNASRIAAVIGTLKRKGDPTPDRPHRRSQLVSVPQELNVVSEELLMAIANQVPKSPKPPPNPNGNRVKGSGSLQDLLDRQGIEYRAQPPDSQGTTWYHVRRCPFHDDGDDFECGVGQKLPDGPLAGKCFHPEGTGKGWREFKAALGIQLPSPAVAIPGLKEAPCLEPTEFPLTESGNGELFAWLYGDRIRFDHARQRWLLWDQHRWAEDLDGEVFRLTKDATRLRYRSAEQVDDPERRKRIASFAIGSESRQRIESAMALAKRERPIADPGTHWDQQPWLLGIGNGVLDLKTGLLRQGIPEDRITMYVPIDFDLHAPTHRWSAFLEEVFQGDRDLIDFIQRAVGYSLTGSTAEQVLFMCYGSGSNGKSVFLTILRWLAGGYALNIPFTALELQQRATISNDIASLAGRRLVTSSETNESTRLNEARIKALTGGDPITARFLYHEAFTFVPSAKFWLSVNQLPQVRDDSHGFWRRVRVIPFRRRFSDGEADRELASKLHGELPGILAWAVRGALSWQSSGLLPPASVSSATEAYRQDSDELSGFIADCCVVAEGAHVQPGKLYDAYQQWAEKMGIPLRQRNTLNLFSRRIRERFQAGRSNGERVYRGIGLVAEDRDGYSVPFHKPPLSPSRVEDFMKKESLSVPSVPVPDDKVAP